MFSKPLSPFQERKTNKRIFQSEPEVLPCFELNYKFLERHKNPLSLATTRKQKNPVNTAQKMASKSSTKQDGEATTEEVPGSIVTYAEEEVNTFKDDMSSENTKKSTSTSVCRLQSWCLEKYKTELNLNSISATEAPQLLKHFFFEIRQTGKENNGKEYEPGSLQTYRNGLRRYFLQRPCPPAPDNFDIENFEEVVAMLSVKKKDLKKEGLGNKPNASEPLEDHQIEQMWSSGAIGLQNPRSLLRLVWWNNVTHLGMRALKEQYDCQIEDFTVNEEYVECKERQTKNPQGDEGSRRKRARKYNTKIWKTDGGERDPYRAFVEYVGHRPQGDKVPGNFFLTPVDGPTTNVWYKTVPVGRNTLAKEMKTIASIASLDGKFTNSSGRKTVIQSLREDFHPLEISELIGHANPDSISSYSHNPLQKQRRMSNKLAGFSSNTTTTVTAANASGGPRTEALREVYVNSPALPSVVGNNTTAMNDGSDGLTARALGGLFTNVSFNNSPVNISINLRSNVHPSDSTNGSCPQ